MISDVPSTDRIALLTVALGYSCGGCFLLHLDQEGHVRQQATCADPVQHHQIGVGHTAPSALVSPRWIDKAVAHHPGAACKSRTNESLDVIRPRRGEKQRLAAAAP